MFVFCYQADCHFIKCRGDIYSQVYFKSLLCLASYFVIRQFVIISSVMRPFIDRCILKVCYAQHHICYQAGSHYIKCHGAFFDRHVLQFVMPNVDFVIRQIVIVLSFMVPFIDWCILKVCYAQDHILLLGRFSSY